MLLLVVLCTFLAWYVWLTLRVRKDFRIVQVRTDTLTDTVLHEKYPVLIHDVVDDLNQLANAPAFRYLHFFKDAHAVKTVPTRTTSRFTLLHHVGKEDQELQVTSLGVSVPMRVEPANVIVLPAGWGYETKEGDKWDGIELNDLTHRLFFPH
jgi:hypothetical protein